MQDTSRDVPSSIDEVVVAMDRYVEVAVAHGATKVARDRSDEVYEVKWHSTRNARPVRIEVTAEALEVITHIRVRAKTKAEGDTFWHRYGALEDIALVQIERLLMGRPPLDEEHVIG